MKKLATVNPKNQLFENMSHLHKILFAFLTSAACLAAKSEPRIVTVGGAATEIVFALGAGEQVVAVDLSSTYPEEVTELPQVGYIRNISPEGIMSMRPDMIVATESLGPPAAKQMLKEMAVQTVWLPEPNSVEALETSIREVGVKLGKREEAEKLVSKVQSQIQAAKDASADWSERPTAVFFLNPPGANGGARAGGGGTRADALIELAGGENVADFDGFQAMSLESLILLNPDVIFIGVSEGHGATAASVEALKKLPAMQSLKAVKNDAVYGVPMEDLSFGPRLGEAAERWHGYLAEAN